MRQESSSTKIAKVSSVASTKTKQRIRREYKLSISSHRIPPINVTRYNLIQEDTAFKLYELLVATTLWNRTRSIQAKPVFYKLIAKYPTPGDLAGASESDLAALLQPLGLHNTRARRLLDFADAWVRDPPSKHKRYRKLHYPELGDGLDVGKDEVLNEDDPRVGWEIGHLPTVGPYALDSFRIFHRDIMRGLAKDWKGTGAAERFEPEWKRVTAEDKELKAYLKWMWLREGWIWNPATGKKVKASAARMRVERTRTKSLSPELI